MQWKCIAARQVLVVKAAALGTIPYSCQHRMEYLEEAFGTGTSCMDDSLRNSLAIKLCQLLNKVVVLQEHWATYTSSQGLVVVPHWSSTVCCPVGAVMS